MTGDIINVSVFKGTVELDNLTLKRGALHKLGLPLYVETGRISRLSVDIPWTSLKSKPVHTPDASTGLMHSLHRS